MGEDPLPGYGPVTSTNRPVRTRMPGGVGAGGEKPPATRLAKNLLTLHSLYSQVVRFSLDLMIRRDAIAILPSVGSLAETFMLFGLVNSTAIKPQ